MVTTNDVVQELQNRGASYDFSGSCVLARDDCQRWLEPRHVHGEKVEGVLVAPPGSQMTMLDGVVPATTAVSYKNTYTLTAQGIWTLRSTSSGTVTAPRHSVIGAQLEDAYVLVDWGLGQFSQLPAELFFYQVALAQAVDSTRYGKPTNCCCPKYGERLHLVCNMSSQGVASS